MKPQAIFEKVCRHLFAQGKQAKTVENGICMYRGPDNTKCAVGALISDKVYRKGMEENDLQSLLGKFTLPAFIVDNENMLQDLQYIHDNNESWTTETTLRNKLRDCAHGYGLDVDFLNELHFPTGNSNGSV